MVVLTVLSNKEEELIHNALKKNALTKCNSYLEDLVACTRSRTLTVYFACQKQTTALNECLGPFTTETERDKLREVHIKQKQAWVEAGMPDNTPPRPGQKKAA